MFKFIAYLIWRFKSHEYDVLSEEDVKSSKHWVAYGEPISTDQFPSTHDLDFFAECFCNARMSQFVMEKQLFTKKMAILVLNEETEEIKGMIYWKCIIQPYIFKK